ncbi:MAG: hypothetical protein MI976_10480 [Pseudomonadales bacterium]|nr:hypothetical protein [Pseudomonadales bacterium]
MYYFITEDLDNTSIMNFVGHSEKSGKRLWVSGQKFSEPYPQDVFYVKPCMESGKEMPDFFDSTVPLMSKRMVQAIESLGIDNFDSYPVIIKEQNTENEWHDYLAINIIGLVDAIDREKSDIDEDDDYVFHSTVIDNSRTHGLYCFRLYRGSDLLVVHEKIAKALIKMNLKGVLIIKTEDYDEDDYF